VNAVALLERALRSDPGRPLLTWYDDDSGERVELSVATTANWTTKAANLLNDDYALGPGSQVGLGDPLHWLAPVYVLAGWTVGAEIVTAGADVVVPDGDPAAFQQAVLAQPDVLVLPPDPTPLDGGDDQMAEGARVLTSHAFDTVVGQRVLVDVLAAGGSLVIVRNADPARLDTRCATERVTQRRD
jgi:hypothetical protein